MKLPFAEPYAAGSERARQAKAVRDLATEISRLQPQALTRTNGEEADHGPQYPANFTKGLAHDKNGVLAFPEDYRCFVEAINAPDPTLFEKDVQTFETRERKNDPDAELPFNCKRLEKTKSKTLEKVSAKWRGWESPRAGHVFELEGPDAGAVGMAPAPRVGSSELAAEMAEVYGLAILRDVPFSVIAKGGGEKLCGDDKKGKAELSAKDVVDHLNDMDFFKGIPDKMVSSTPHFAGADWLNRFDRNRLEARLQ